MESVSSSICVCLANCPRFAVPSACYASSISMCSIHDAAVGRRRAPARGTQQSVQAGGGAGTWVWESISIFTGSPTASCPSTVTRRVSGMRYTENSFAPTSPTCGMIRLD